MSFSLTSIPLDIRDSARLTKMEAWRRESGEISLKDVIQFIIQKEGFITGGKDDYQQISTGYGTRFTGVTLSREEAFLELFKHMMKDVYVLFQVSNYLIGEQRISDFLQEYVQLAIDSGASQDFVLDELDHVKCFRRDGLILELAYNGGRGLAKTMITTAPDPIEYYRGIVYVTENGSSRIENGLLARRREGLEVFNV